jgi:DnaJ-class molecular chaperone
MVDIIGNLESKNDNAVEWSTCNACEGSGDGDEGEDDYGCPYCNGSGRVKIKNKEKKK